MIINISLTRALAEALNINNLKPNNETVPDFTTYYADIITKDRQKTIMFFNTQNSWITISYLKDTKKNLLESFVSSIRETLVREGIMDYIIDKYLDDITDIKLSLTSSKSIVARMSTKKKDIHSFYERYYDVPDAKELHNDKEFNSWICKNPYSKKDMDYIVPYEEMGYMLLNKYKDSKIEENNHQKYLTKKDQYYPYYSSPLDLSKMSDEEINRLNRSLNKKDSYCVSIYQIRRFYEEHQNPNLEDYFDFIYSQFHFALIDDFKEERCYCRLFALDERILQLYKQYHSRKYRSTIHNQ